MKQRSKKVETQKNIAKGQKNLGMQDTWIVKKQNGWNES
jgi:hypothetical protein